MEQTKKTLIIGGTGIIGRNLSAEVQENGHKVYVISRGEPKNPIHGVTYLKGNVRLSGEIKAITGGGEFDYIIDLLSFNVQHLEYMTQEIKGICDHYIFMSSATVYEDSPTPITEKSPLLADGWNYPLQKIRAEQWLHNNMDDLEMSYTIVRPYIIYSTTRIPLAGWEGYAILERIRNGAPIPIGNEILDSTTTLTHSADLARGIASLTTSRRTSGEIFHITASSATTWRKVYQDIARLFSTELYVVDASIGQMSNVFPELKGKFDDRAKNRTFDNSSIQSATRFIAPAMNKKLYLNTLEQFMQSNQKIDYLLQGRIDSLIKATNPTDDIWGRTLEHRRCLLLGKGVMPRVLYFLGYYRLLFVLAKTIRGMLTGNRVSSDYS